MFRGMAGQKRLGFLCGAVQQFNLDVRSDVGLVAVPLFEQAFVSDGFFPQIRQGFIDRIRTSAVHDSVTMILWRACALFPTSDRNGAGGRGAPREHRRETSSDQGGGPRPSLSSTSGSHRGQKGHLDLLSDYNSIRLEVVALAKSFHGCAVTPGNPGQSVSRPDDIRIESRSRTSRWRRVALDHSSCRTGFGCRSRSERFLRECRRSDFLNGCEVGAGRRGSHRTRCDHDLGVRLYAELFDGHSDRR